VVIDWLGAAPPHPASKSRKAANAIVKSARGIVESPVVGAHRERTPSEARRDPVRMQEIVLLPTARQPVNGLPIRCATSAENSRNFLSAGLRRSAAGWIDQQGEVREVPGGPAVCA
jgi:hypothetical protein